VDIKPLGTAKAEEEARKGRPKGKPGGGGGGGGGVWGGGVWGRLDKEDSGKKEKGASRGCHLIKEDKADFLWVVLAVTIKSLNCPTGLLVSP